jgi:hypothetical protein
MTQLDDLQGYVNNNMPLRPAQLRWDNPDVSYDGDPNDGGAPTIFSNAPAGTVYLQSDDTRWRKKAAGFWSLATDGGGGPSTSVELWVDPAGDDSNPGTETEPLATLYEATLRIPLLGNSTIYLSAGTFELPNWQGTNTRTVLRSNNLTVYGTIETIESFTVDSTTGNVITAQGSPGWSVDEHKDRFIRHIIYGTTYASFRILSNTADTLTVAISTPAIGGYTHAPTNGTVLAICENASVIGPGSDPYYSSYLYYAGVVTFRNVCFDGSTGSGGGRCGVTGQPYSKGTFIGCDFLHWSADGVVGFGCLAVAGCRFDDCYEGVLADQFSTVNSDNVFQNGTVGITARTGMLWLNHGCGAWMENMYCYLLTSLEGFVDDGGTRIWVEGSCAQYAIVRASGRYNKSAYALIGWPGKDTFTSRVIAMEEFGAYVGLFNSALSTLKPDATFFRIIATNYSLSEYIANGADADFPGGNRVTG